MGQQVTIVMVAAGRKPAEIQRKLRGFGVSINEVSSPAHGNAKTMNITLPSDIIREEATPTQYSGRLTRQDVYYKRGDLVLFKESIIHDGETIRTQSIHFD